MRPIDSDKFLQDMADLYRQAGWDEREVHFSLADLRSNIGTEDVILIPQREPDTVPVIRCKDCRFRDQFGFCRRWLWQKAPKMEDEEYCSGAERKEE